MKSRERVLTAINHVKPDRIPTDFQFTDEVWQSLRKHFNTTNDEKIFNTLDIDSRWIWPEFTGPVPKINNDCTFEGWGGSLYKKVKNQYGTYDDVCEFVLDKAETPEDIDKYLKLPNLDHYNFESITQQCKEKNEYCIFTGYCSVFYFPTLVRSMENIFLDMALNPEMAHYLINRVVDWHMRYHERILEAGKGRIDVLQIADDFSTQRGPLFSIEMFRQFFKEPMKKFVDLGKSYNANIFLHCCGSAYEFIPDIIDIGIEILDPIQVTATNMEPSKLKKEFGNDLAFHGAMDTQNTLPHGNPDEVREEAKLFSKILGSDGGYILTPCHRCQPDVPVENILAMYEIENRYI